MMREQIFHKKKMKLEGKGFIKIIAIFKRM